MSEFSIRPFVSGDEPVFLELLRELAVFEKIEHLLTATEDDLTSAFLGENPSAGAMMAEDSAGHAVGYAIWFQNFSSFLSRPGVYLEDIYVRPEARGMGLGKALLKEVAGIALKKKAGRMEWVVLDWNQGAIDFYKRIGAEVLDEWRLVRMDEKGIEAFLAS